MWETLSWTVVLGDALFDCLSEKSNYWAKSRALELTHTEGKKLRLELLLPTTILKFLVVLSYIYVIINKHKNGLWYWINLNSILSIL